MAMDHACVNQLWLRQGGDLQGPAQMYLEGCNYMVIDATREQASLEHSGTRRRWLHSVIPPQLHLPNRNSCCADADTCHTVHPLDIEGLPAARPDALNG